METASKYGADIQLPQLTIMQDFLSCDEDGKWDRSILAALEGTHDHGAGPVTVTVLQENGPGGGNPEVKFDGNAPALLAFLLKHYTGGQLTGPNGALSLLGE
jgi:hypothetical protein